MHKHKHKDTVCEKTSLNEHENSFECEKARICEKTSLNDKFEDEGRGGGIGEGW